MDITIIVPAYNEKSSIAHILNTVTELDFNDLKKEIIVVDDGSVDGTNEILSNFEGISDLIILRHEKNLGKGAAIRTGLKHSTGSIIALQDSDLEYDPGQLPKLIKPICEGEDVVYGSRFLGSVKNMSPLFYIGNRALTYLTHFLYRVPITDMETGFKIFRREVIDGIELESTGFEIEPELTAKILKKGYTIREIPIEYYAREKKQKKITVIDGLKAFYTLIKYRFR